MKRHIGCRQRWLGFLLIFSFIAIQWVTPADSPCQSSNLTIGNYVKVSETRISRTVYEYTYHASITNSGPGVLNVVATVASNSACTSIVDNTLNFGDVPAGATVSSSDTFTIRQDRLYAFNWSNLTWNISFQATQSSRTVGQEGGTLEFHNGLVLEVPQGAVPGPTQILIKDLPLDQVNAILTNPLLSPNRTKRFLGGFKAEPDGLVFNGPVLATIPVLPLNPYEILAQVEIFLNEQRYRYVTSQFEYLGGQGVVRVNIQHFSGEGFVGLTPTEEDEEWKAKCTGCPDPGLPFPPECDIDPLQKPCCNLIPEVRITCAQAIGCQCCKEGNYYAEQIGIDFATGECQLLGIQEKITYYDCKDEFGNPITIPYSVGESTCKDLDLKITIVPAEMTLAAGSWSNDPFKAFITGTWNTGPMKGKIVFKNASISPVWTSEAPEIADFPDPKTGKIFAYKSNPDPIVVSATVSSKDLPDIKKDASVTVTGDYIDIWPGDDDLCPGQQIRYEAHLKNSAKEDLGQIDVDWSIIEVIPSSSGAPVARCNDYPCPSGPVVWVTAGPGEGTAEITAHNVQYNLSASVHLDVYREIPKIKIASYQSGDNAYAAGANLVGTIVECGTRLVKFIQVTNVTNGSNTLPEVPVGDDGKFSVLVNLDWGINYLKFLTRDANHDLVPNNMANKVFWLRRVPHCVKIGGENPPKLPTVLYGTPVTWYSEKPEIATVDAIPGDPQHVAVTGHAKGWAKLYTYWEGYTVVRWVGVSTGTNYVPTHQDDPFYRPEHVLSPAVAQMLWQMGYEALHSDLNDKYFTGGYEIYYSPQPSICGLTGFGAPILAGFLYDGTSIQSIFLPAEYPSICTEQVHPSAVNEKGQVVGDIWKDTRDVGFIYSQGALSLIADPFAYDTYLHDINNLGKAVGWSSSGAGSTWGFIYDVVSKTFTYIASIPVYINDSGQVLVGINSINGWSYLIYKDGVYETVVGPSAIDGLHLHESGQVWVAYENGQSVLLTRCAPGN